MNITCNSYTAPFRAKHRSLANGDTRRRKKRLRFKLLKKEWKRLDPLMPAAMQAVLRRVTERLEGDK